MLDDLERLIRRQLPRPTDNELLCLVVEILVPKRKWIERVKELRDFCDPDSIEFAAGGASIFASGTAAHVRGGGSIKGSLSFTICLTPSASMISRLDRLPMPLSM